MFGSFESRRSVVASGIFENKIPAPIFIEKRELLVRGHPLRKLEKPSRYIRIPEGTHGGRRRLFRS